MHLSAEIVLDWTEGRLDRDQELFWKQHLDNCKGCMQEVSHWRQLALDLKLSHLRSAPSTEVQTAIDVFPKSNRQENPGIRAVLAAVVFDSLIQPAFAGARGASSAARQLVMRAEEFDIHVKIWGDDHHHRQMLGQLLPRSGQTFVHSARFHLLCNGERIESTAVDDLGEFRFSDVPDGTLSLQIDLPNLTVIGALNI